MNKRQNLFLIGPMGAGKTSIGREIARKLRLDFYDSDQVIEQRCGADIPWIYDVEGEAGFQQREVKVIAELTKLRGIVLATGGGVVALAENRAALAANGVVIYLKASLAGQLERTGYSRKRPLSPEDTIRGKTLHKLYVEYEPLYNSLADLIFDTDGHAVGYIASNVVKTLKNKGYI